MLYIIGFGLDASRLLEMLERKAFVPRCCQSATDFFELENFVTGSEKGLGCFIDSSHNSRVRDARQ
jgi:hypothetical protein